MITMKYSYGTWMLPFNIPRNMMLPFNIPRNMMLPFNIP